MSNLLTISYNQFVFTTIQIQITFGYDFPELSIKKKKGRKKEILRTIRFQDDIPDNNQ